LADHHTPLHLITRGPLIVRDVDVLSDAARRANVSITFSVPTLDHEIWRTTEIGTAPPRQRLRALRQLVDAGLDVGVGMAPILPGLSDKPELMADVVRAARDAGATGVWANLLYLRPGTREHFLDRLGRDWPELLPRYERLYEDRAYLPKPLTEPVRSTVRELVRANGVEDRRTVRLAPPPEPEQLAFPLMPGDPGLRWPGPARPDDRGLRSGRGGKPAHDAGLEDLAVVSQPVRGEHAEHVDPHDLSIQQREGDAADGVARGEQRRRAIEVVAADERRPGARRVDRGGLVGDRESRGDDGLAAIEGEHRAALDVERLGRG
jgi:hypothetical protein